jgi:hypothetical protein
MNLQPNKRGELAVGGSSGLDDAMPTGDDDDRTSIVTAPPEEGERDG